MEALSQVLISGRAVSAICAQTRGGNTGMGPGAGSPNPKGDRVKITMSGKFLPYKYYGAEQGMPEYGFKETT